MLLKLFYWLLNESTEDVMAIGTIISYLIGWGFLCILFFFCRYFFVIIIFLNIGLQCEETRKHTHMHTAELRRSRRSWRSWRSRRSRRSMLRTTIVRFECSVSHFTGWWVRNPFWCSKWRHSPERKAFRRSAEGWRRPWGWWWLWRRPRRSRPTWWWEPPMLWWWLRPDWSSGGRFSCLAVCYLSSTSCAGSGTRFWFDAPTGRGCAQFRCGGVALNSGWSGTLSPVPASGSACRTFSAVSSLRWHLQHLNIKKIYISIYIHV